jgi:hypothetical protein
MLKKSDFENLEQKALGYNLNFADPLNIRIKNGFTEVLDAATGFMCIKKEVFYKMIEAYPNLKYTTDQIINNGERYSVVTIVMHFLTVLLMKKVIDIYQKIMLFADYGKKSVVRFMLMLQVD